MTEPTPEAFRIPEPIHPSLRLKALGAQARKRFGQNFLASEGVISGIVRAAELKPGQRVLEIGPGLGAMTRALLEAGVQLTVVELDRDMAGHLRDWLGPCPRLRIIEGDALRQDWAALFDAPDGGLPDDEKIVVVANLPYNVGTTILTSLLARPELFSRLVLMLQREVADRVVAAQGDRDRGSLSMYCEARASRRIALKVPPGAFVPAPKVHSAVLDLRLFPVAKLDGQPAEAVEAVLRAAFASPRKTLRRGLADHYGVERVDQALHATGVEGSLRPAELSLAQATALAAALEGPGAADGRASAPSVSLSPS